MFVSRAVSGSNVKRTYKLGVLVPFNKGWAHVDGSSAQRYAQAIPVAMEKIKTMNYNFNLTWVWNDTMCNDSLAIQQQIWQLHNGVDAFVGPARNCKHTLRTAVAFNKPVMSFVSREKKLLAFFDSVPVQTSIQCVSGNVSL